MGNDCVIVCGGQAQPSATAATLSLNLWPGAKNVDLRIEDVHQQFWKNVPGRFEDLLEIATYVYCADQATPRGSREGQSEVDSFGAKWRRRFRFHIPVREPDFWNRDDVKQALCGTLQFLSEDVFDFTFTGASNAPAIQDYLDLGSAADVTGAPEQVVLFSGGLDSLAGAVEEAVVQKRRIMLVNHRPTPKLNNVHRQLEKLLGEKAGTFRPIHLHVRINKSSKLNKEYTQRTRSFLYVALGATVSAMLGQKSVRFYENGVVSLNLPVCAQVVGSRATRTTHPRVLAGYQRLLTLVADAAFSVENPFIWDTKGEMVSRIVRADCGHLIDASISCAHTWEISKKFTHCGLCSQCIDRRFGVVAAKAETFDSAEHYGSDVFIGARPDNEDKTMVAMYLERANQVRNIATVADFIMKYPEVARVFGYMPGVADAVAQRVLGLYKRHGGEVNAVVEQMIGRHVKAIRERTLPGDCLLRMVIESGGLVSTPTARNGTDAKKDGSKARVEKPAVQRGRRAAASEAKPGPRYLLRKARGVWELVFDGKPDIIADERGIVLVAQLLLHPPDVPIHAVKLESLVDDKPIDVAGLGAIEDSSGVVILETGAVVQEASGAKLGGGSNAVLKAKLQELVATRDNVTLPESERTKASEEYDELLRSAARGGKMSDEATRSADRVRKAIKRLIDGLKKKKSLQSKGTLQVFAEHLETYLWRPSMGVAGGKRRKGAAGGPGQFTYEPPAGVKWKG